MQGLVVCAMGTLMPTIYQHYAGGDLSLIIIYLVMGEKKERNLLLKKNIFLPLTQHFLIYPTQYYSFCVTVRNVYITDFHST